MPKYFGTDGVRAVAGQFPLVKDFIEKLGYSALNEQKLCQRLCQLGFSDTGGAQEDKRADWSLRVDRKSVV